MGAPNPAVLKWARETAGLSYDEAARKLGMTGQSAVDTLQAYETGQKAPSRSRLQRMAKQYHRSYLTFFLNKPPVEVDRGEDFRKLPSEQPEEPSGLLNALVRDIFVRQQLVKDALIEAEEDFEIPFVAAATQQPGVSEGCEAIKNFFGVDLQRYRQYGPHEGFAYLRECVEKKGIYVILIGDLGSHHSKVSPNTFRGFALSDSVAPFAVINNHDAKTAWSFTLLHELVHIWLGKTGVSGQISDHVIEKYCNDVASELLITSEEIEKINIAPQVSKKELLSEISKVMQSANVSGSLIIYRMYREGRIDKKTWETLQEELYKLWLDSKSRNRDKSNNNGGNYYNTQRHKVGPGLLRTVSRSIQEGTLTETKAGKVLGVSAGNVTEMFGAN